MTEAVILGPPEEQSICVTCGFCCDGTLFLHAHLNPGERGTGDLPGWIEQNSFSKEGKDYFRLPCQYFSEKCTIYDRRRADVCSSFRCQLLIDFSEEKVSVSEALHTVREAASMRNSLMEQYRKVSGKSENVCFLKLLQDLGKLQDTEFCGETYTRDIDILQARCNILEVLLIRHFRPVSDFEKMIMH